MPEYNAPAVYVEETSYRPKPLEGASTSTTAFVGQTRRGPVSSDVALPGDAAVPVERRNMWQDLLTPELVTSVGDFERIYGLTAPIGGQPNYLAHAVRAFFHNGGRRLYVARVLEVPSIDAARAVQHTGATPPVIDWLLGNGTGNSARFEARFPGSAGNGRVVVTESRAPASTRSLQRAVAGTMAAAPPPVAATPASVASTLDPAPATYLVGIADTLSIDVDAAGPVAVDLSGVTDGAATLAEIVGAINTAAVAGLETVAEAEPITLTTTGTSTAATITLAGTALAALGFVAGTTTGDDAVTETLYVKRTADEDSLWQPSSGGADVTAATITNNGTVQARTITFTVEAFDEDGYSQVFDGLGLAANHPRSIRSVLGHVPPRRVEQLENLVALELRGTVTPFALYTPLTTGADANNRVTFHLRGGVDGAAPLAERFTEGLEAIDGVDGVSIIAAPGSSALASEAGVRAALIQSAERRGAYRIAVLDAPERQTQAQVRDIRASMDSDHAALYHPWVVISNPDARPGDSSRPLEIPVPPSGHVCGIYARNDAERGVHKAPANEVVLGALRFAQNITMGQQEVLNPEGINVLRSFRGRGHRVWGARLASSDPEFRYVNVRRYFNYIASTLDRGTQWVVFEPNNEQLWERVTSTVSDFLYNEWTDGALLGRTANEAFFVRCGRATMTQSDIDNGRLICEVGMAIVYPAEFVIFRIGQKTATATS